MSEFHCIISCAIDGQTKSRQSSHLVPRCLRPPGYFPCVPPNLPSRRVSTRHLKQLLGRVCRVAEDGKRLLFEYSQRLAPAAVDAKEGVRVLVEGDGNRAGKTPLESQRTA